MAKDLMGLPIKGPRCPKHPAYRGIDAPQLQKYCPGCENVWVWAIEMRRQKAERKERGEPRVARSLSEFRRLTTQGALIERPEWESEVPEEQPDLMLGTPVRED